MAGGRQWGGAKWTGGRRRRSPNALTGTREAAALAVTLGRELRTARLAARLTQQQVGDRIGVSHARYGDMERGRGAGSPIGLWIAAGIAVGRPVAVTMSRPTTRQPKEAGHLGAQEAVLRWAAAAGNPGTFELQTHPAPNATYIDACIRDNPRRLLEVVEIWNTIDDFGAATRLFKRKLVEAGEIAVAIGGDAPFQVRGCWILRDTAANRSLVRSYPAIIRAQFPGSSKRWADALMSGGEPPTESGIVWIDVAATRLSELRLRATRANDAAQNRH